MKRWFGILLLVTGCSSYDLGAESADEIAVDLDNPTWENSIEPLVRAKCATCHTTTRGPYVPTNTPTTYDDILTESFFNSQAATIQNRVLDDQFEPMPPKFATPLTTNEKAALQTYLNGV